MYLVGTVAYDASDNTQWICIDEQDQLWKCIKGNNDYPIGLIKSEFWLCFDSKTLQWTICPAKENGFDKLYLILKQ